MREDYRRSELLEENLFAGPLDQFKSWFSAAEKAGLPEPNAMTLATCTSDGRPSARVVLLKGIDHGGLVFFTNYESRKGYEMAENPHAALLFSWLELQRQIRIEGLVEKIHPEESAAYFQSRPKGSQIGAWASPQSTVISGRAFLESAIANMEKRFEGVDPLPRPPQWGGYRVKPYRFEFWQGRSSRLHDRLIYEPGEGGTWHISRLAP